MSRVLGLVWWALALICHGSIGASAQTYPERVVKLIVPLGAGSGVDIGARILADRLTARWGKPVIVENHPGGDGLIAISAFLAASDSHTLLFSLVAILVAPP